MVCAVARRQNKKTKKCAADIAAEDSNLHACIHAHNPRKHEKCQRVSDSASREIGKLVFAEDVVFCFFYANRSRHALMPDKEKTARGRLYK